MGYEQEDYNRAIAFALNYPEYFQICEYDEEKDIWIVEYLEGVWHTIKLEGKFVRSCLKYEGEKEWIKKKEL